MVSRKAQAAVEFLTTYGWAVLIIVVVLIALGWLGVFNVQQHVPDQCRFPIGTVSCIDAKVVWDGTDTRLGSLTIRNDFNRQISICEVACTAEKPNPDGTINGRLTLRACNIGQVSIPPGAEATLELGMAGGSNIMCYDAAGRSNANRVGSRYSGKIYLVDYQLIGTSADVRVITGDIVATVQPA